MNSLDFFFFNLFTSTSLRTENMFNCLYPGDDGLESPNPANKFLFNNTG